MNRIKLFNLAISLILITACGNGGGQVGGFLLPTKATVEVSTSGNLDQGAQIGGIEVTIVLPTGVTVDATMDGEKMVVDANSLAAAPAASDSLISGTYTPATLTDPGMVHISIASANGFATGSFAVLACSLNGTSPSGSDFGVDLTSFTAYASEIDSTLDVTSSLTPGLRVSFR